MSNLRKRQVKNAINNPYNLFYKNTLNLILKKSIKSIVNEALFLLVFLFFNFNFCIACKRLLYKGCQSGNHVYQICFFLKTTNCRKKANKWATTHPIIILNSQNISKMEKNWLN